MFLFKINKYFMVIIFVSLFSTIYSQKTDSVVGNTIISLYGKIMNYSDSIDNLRFGPRRFNYDVDSMLNLRYGLEAADSALTNYLTDSLSEYDFNIVFDKKELDTCTGLNIIESDDGKVRFINWDSHCGAIIEQYITVLQYKIWGGCKTELICRGNFAQDYFNVHIDNLYTMKLTDCREPYYLVSGAGKYQQFCKDIQLLVFSIINDTREDATIVTSKNEETDNPLIIQYNNLDMKIDWEPSYIIHTDKNIIYEPILSDKIYKKLYTKYHVKCE
jgi:hypothetical protein